MIKIKIKIILILLFLTTTVNGLTVLMYDQTEGYEDSIHIYQNDNNSDNYIKSINIEGNATLLEPFSLGDSIGYTIQLESKYHTALRNPNDSSFLSFWFDYLRYYGFGFLIIFGLGVLIWKSYWKRN